MEERQSLNRSGRRAGGGGGGEGGGGGGVVGGRTRRTLPIPMDDYGAVQETTTSDTARIVNNMDDNLPRNERSINVDEQTIDLQSQHSRHRFHWTKDSCFRDGKRKTDFVLVEEEEKDVPNVNRERNEKFRQKFKKNLELVGVQLEEERVEGSKMMTVFVKVHVPWNVMCFYAESLQLRAPLQLRSDVRRNWSETIFSRCGLPNPMSLTVPNRPPSYFTCPFKTAKLKKFVDSDNHELFFTARERQKVAYEILVKTTYGHKSKAEIGIDRLVDDKVFAAAYSLHDGDFNVSRSQEADPDSWNQRQMLYEYWARWGRWYKYQPIEHIREYFGEKIAIYFAWLGFYTAWLLPASVVGIIVFLFGVAFGPDNQVSESCASGKAFRMCPFCDGCPPWYLSDKCVFVKISAILDHPGTVFYSVFMSFWAVSFLEYWKRKTADLSCQWDCMEMVEEEEPPRPAYAEKCVEYGVNPVTGVKEPFFPKNSRIKRMATGLGIILLMMCVVLIFIVAVIVYRIIVTIALDKSKTMAGYESVFASISSSVLNLLVIMFLGNIYQKLATKLTEWEMHRTQSEFEDQLIFKVFIFQFVNFYSAIIYVGFFKGKFAGIPGDYNKMLGLRQEECSNAGCMTELALNLIVVMIGKQMINNCQELLIPKLKACYHHWKIGLDKKNAETTRWEEDYEIIENEGLFDEYLEMVIQFGFITIFVAAFPLAPLFALLNNWMEIRLDAHKFVCETRRPVAEKCQNIGVWFTILESLAHISVISNAFLIAFSSEFLPKQLYKYTHHEELVGYVNFTLAWAPNNSIQEAPCRYKDFRDENGDVTSFYWQLLCLRLLFIVIFEHVVFGVCKLIDLMVPDIPESIELKAKRERYLARQALMDTDTHLMPAGEQEDDEKTNTGNV